MKAIFNKFFAAEIVSAIIAPFAFWIISNRTIASLVAGSGFILIGVSVLILAKIKPEFRKSLTFKIGVVHFALTMIVVLAKFLNLGTEFKDVVVFGIPGQLIHYASTAVFFAMMAGTALDAFKARHESGVTPSKA